MGIFAPTSVTFGEAEAAPHVPSAIREEQSEPSIPATKAIAKSPVHINNVTSSSHPIVKRPTYAQILSTNRFTTLQSEITTPMEVRKTNKFTLPSLMEVRKAVLKAHPENYSRCNKCKSVTQRSAVST